MPDAPVRCRCCRPCLRAGANQGLGYQTSLELARRGATLYMVSSQVTHCCGSSRRDLLTCGSLPAWYLRPACVLPALHACPCCAI